MASGNNKGPLALAACSLLGAGVAHAADGDWSVDSGLLYWSEASRVTAVEPEVGLRQDLGDERTLDAKVVADVLTGASHNGAKPQPYAQTFTSPSGGGANYTVPANAVPLDPNFQDFRTSFSLNYTTPLENRLWKSSIGGNFSTETDFFSMGTNGTLSRDFNKRNTTLTGGISLEADWCQPQNGAPTPFGMVGGSTGTGGGGETEGEGGGGGGGLLAGPFSGEQRTVVDGMLGLTQILDRSTLVQFNVDVSYANGYMNDPYKVVSISDLPNQYVWENRPGTRTKTSFYTELKHGFDRGDVADVSYRYMTDDWGIVSHTVDAHYRWKLGDAWYLEPHARWYTQTAADFFMMDIASSSLPVPGTTSAYASGDYRLGALTDTTAGLKIGRRFGEDGEASFRLERMQQRGDWSPANVDATIAEFDLSFKF